MCLYRGTFEATRNAHIYISRLVADPDADVSQMIPKITKQGSTSDRATVCTINGEITKNGEKILYVLYL